MVAGMRSFKFSSTFFSRVCPQFISESGNLATGISPEQPDHNYKTQDAPVARPLQTEPHRSLDSMAFCDSMWKAVFDQKVSMGTAAGSMRQEAPLLVVCRGLLE